MKLTCGVLLMLVLLSCSAGKTSFKDEQEMLKYINDPEHGYISFDENGDFKMEAKLIPAIEDDSIPQFTMQVRLSRKDGLSVLEYGKVQQAQALEREGYLSFEVLQDVYVESGEYIGPAISNHYERNYGLKPSIDMFFRFNQFTPKDEVTLVYRDQLFEQGMFRIKFNKALFTSCHVYN